MLVKNLSVEANLFLGGEGVEHAADGVHFTGDGFCGAPLRALEDHVFHEVGEAVLFGDFTAGGGSGPDADTGGGALGNGFWGNPAAVWQNMILYMSRFAYPRIIVSHPGGGKETETRN